MMSEKLTSIAHPNESQGLCVADWGEKTAQEMIAMLRRHHQKNLEDAQRMLAYSDGEFQIEIVRGSIVQKPVKVLQESSLSKNEAPA